MDRRYNLLDDGCSSYDERGLLGLAFHPGYAENGRELVPEADRAFWGFKREVFESPRLLQLHHG